jgi:tripartite ATP-independent transporter DctP family solute receptor
MKKYIFFLVITVLIVFPAVAGGKSETSSKQVKLTYGHIFAPDTLPGKGGYKFVELIKQKSNGMIEVVYKPGAALGDERAHVEQVSTGTIDLMTTGDGMIAMNAPDYGVMTMPFVFRDASHAMKVREGAIGKRMNEEMIKKTGVRIMGWQNIGARQLTSNKMIRSLSDLKGLKLRLPDVKWWIKAWEKTGVNVVTIAFNELYLALQTGTVDAQENPADFIRGQKFYEVQKYLILTHHVQNVQGWYMNNAHYESLSGEQKKWVEESIKEASIWVTEQSKLVDSDAMKFLLSEGKMQIITPDFKGLQDLIKNLPREVGGEVAQKLYEEIETY